MAERNPGRERRPRVLVTGFEPFAGRAENPSGRLLPRLRELLDPDECVIRPPLRVEKDVILSLEDLASYDSIVSLGMCSGFDPARPFFRVETQARNTYVGLESRAADIGRAAGGGGIAAVGSSEPSIGSPSTLTTRTQTHAENVAGGPELLARAWPLAESVGHGPWPEGIEVVAGDETSAGTFVCNNTLYHLLHARLDAVFVHVPDFPHEWDERYARALADWIRTFASSRSRPCPSPSADAR